MNAQATQERTQVLELEQIPDQLPAVKPSQLPAAVITPADLIRIAMESGDKDIDRLERLMAMDLRYREQHETERLRESMLASKRDFAAFRGENVIIPKSKQVDRGKAGSFMQAEFDAVCRLLSPALSQHGFSFRHDQRFGAMEGSGPWVWVTCFLEHRDGHTEKLELEGPPGDLHANTPVQNMQATASYLKRVSLLAITGTATGGEDDENRMHKRSAGCDDQAAGRSEEAGLADAGEAAAMEGMVALTAWWQGLTAKQRSVMNAQFGSLRKAASAADRGVQHGR